MYTVTTADSGVSPVLQEDVKITDEFRAMYDAAVALWADVDTAIRGAREDGSMVRDAWHFAQLKLVAFSIALLHRRCVVLHEAAENCRLLHTAVCDFHSNPATVEHTELNRSSSVHCAEW